MKRLLLILTAALSLVACRKAILEDRTACPSLLYFEISNSDAFGKPDRVQVNAYRYPDQSSLAIDTTTIREMEGRNYFLDIRHADAVRGCGVLGFRECRLENEVCWCVPPGNGFDSLYRFTYLSIVEPELFTVPVEFVKEHCVVTLQFVNASQEDMPKDSFPYEVLVKSNTCGINALTGEPVKGAFECKAQETASGVFQFLLPRQADGQLIMELYGRPGFCPMDGLVHSFNLASILKDLGGVSWQEKNLPDILVGIDFKDIDIQVQVMPWENKDMEYAY